MIALTRDFADLIDQASRVRVEDEIARRGIKLRGKIDRCGPCPVCGGCDRFAINLRKQCFICRGSGAAGDVIAMVMHIDGCSFVAAIETLTGFRLIAACPAPAPMAKSSDEEYEREQHRKADWLWSQRQPIAGSIAERYLRETRGYAGPIPPTVAFLPASKPEHYPAVISAFAVVDECEPGVLTVPREVPSVHLTLLAGCKKAPVERPKLIIGSPKQKKVDGTEVSTPVVLAPVNDLFGLAITEGIEDGLTVASLGLGVWAAGSVGFMPALASVVPSYVECATIFAHRDPAGQRGAHKLARKLHQRGIEVFIEGVAHG
jgi:hypothetical protein